MERERERSNRCARFKLAGLTFADKSTLAVSSFENLTLCISVRRSESAHRSLVNNGDRVDASFRNRVKWIAFIAVYVFASVSSHIAALRVTGIGRDKDNLSDNRRKRRKCARSIPLDQRRDIVFSYPVGHNAAPILQERVAINSRPVRVAAFRS